MCSTHLDMHHSHPKKFSAVLCLTAANPVMCDKPQYAKTRGKDLPRWVFDLKTGLWFANSPLWHVPWAVEKWKTLVRR